MLQAVRCYSFGGATDPYWENVVFLLDMNDGDNLQGSLSGWDDVSPGNHNIQATIEGSGIGPETDTSIVKFGPTSAYYHNTIDRLWLNSAADMNFGSGSFTIEGWFYWSSTPSGTTQLFGKWNRNSQRSWGIQYNKTSGNLQFMVSSNGTTETTKIAYAWAPTLATWYHIAVDFNGSKYRLYLDGVMVGSSTSLTTLFASSGNLQFTIGAGADGGLTDRYFKGNIEDIRITNVARYASDSGFSVPTAAFPRS